MIQCCHCRQISDHEVQLFRARVERRTILGKIRVVAVHEVVGERVGVCKGCLWQRRAAEAGVGGTVLAGLWCLIVTLGEQSPLAGGAWDWGTLGMVLVGIYLGAVILQHAFRGRQVMSRELANRALTRARDTTGAADYEYYLLDECPRPTPDRDGPKGEGP